MADFTGVLPSMEAQIGIGGAMESCMPCPHSKTFTNYVWPDVPGIKNK